MQSIMLNSKLHWESPYATAISNMNLTIDNTTSDEEERRLLKMVNASLIFENNELRELENQEETINEVMGEIIQGAQRCAEFNTSDKLSSFRGSNSNNSNSSNNGNNIDDKAGKEDMILPFERSIMRGSESNVSATKKYSYWRKNSIEKLIDGNTVGSGSGSAYENNKSIVRSTSTETAARALECLTSCFLKVDQMLQLRFQERGESHLEMLRHLVDKDKKKKTKKDINIEEVVETSMTTQAIDQTDDFDDIVTPAAVYEVCKV